MSSSNVGVITHDSPSQVSHPFWHGVDRGLFSLVDSPDGTNGVQLRFGEVGGYFGKGKAAVSGRNRRKALGESPLGHSGASRRNWLVTPGWKVLELPPGVVTPSQLHKALGLPVMTGFEEHGLSHYKESIATSQRQRTSESGTCSVHTRERHNAWKNDVGIENKSAGQFGCEGEGEGGPQAHQRVHVAEKTHREGTRHPSEGVGAESEWGCGAWGIVGRCKNGHAYAKELVCGREWCPRCGKDWSVAHQRRFARWMSKAQQMESVGYFVVEWPLASRDKLRTKQALSDMGKRVKGAMIALGYDRGLRRWHYFGERGHAYNPHLNILVDGGYLSRTQLEDVKSYLRLILDEPDLIVNYGYRKPVGAKVHTLKYVTRATFLHRCWDDEMSHRLFNFQNTNYWGRWDGPAVWSLDDLGNGARQVVGGDAGMLSVQSLLSGVCPDCGEPLDWKRPVDVHKMALEQFGIDSTVLMHLGYGELSGQATEHFAARLGSGGLANRLKFVQQHRGKSEANLCPVSMLESWGAEPLGAGYWRVLTLEKTVVADCPQWFEHGKGG